MTLMFQKEVADRIIAQPNSKSYGRLSVITGWRTRITKLFDLDPRAFYTFTKSLVYRFAF